MKKEDRDVALDPRQFKALGSDRMIDISTIDESDETVYNTIYYKELPMGTKGIDEMQRDVFENKGVRVWHNDEVGVPLPNANNDAILVFTHFVHHFYGLGVGLRQICDWCRLLWTYKNEIDREMLASRLNQIGLMEEWQVFGAFVVKYLGMPEEVMPFYDSKFTRKSSLIQKIVLETGNFGHNRDLSYREKYPKPLMLAITFFRRLYEYSRFVYLFPKNALKFYIIYLTDRIKAVFAGKV